jgi:hypothetical protein
MRKTMPHISIHIEKCMWCGNMAKSLFQSFELERWWGPEDSGFWSPKGLRR